MNHLAGLDSSGKSQSYDTARADLWDRYVGLGLERLHPIIPPDAAPARRWLDWQMAGRGNPAMAMDEPRALAVWQAKNAVGKLPGTWVIDGWMPRNVQKLPYAYTGEKLIDYRLAVARHGGGIGVSGSELIALDIDVVDPFVCLDVQGLLFSILKLPRDCIRRVGLAPKLLIPFRLGSKYGFPKPTPLVLADGKGAVEFLGIGQQFVCEGRHAKAQQDYRWPWGRIWERPGGLRALPEIDEDTAVGALRKLRRALRLKAQPIRRGVWISDRQARWVGPHGAPAALMCSEADARSMIAAVPNLLATPREDYVAVAHHLMGCSGGAAWGRDLFMDWAKQWPGGPDPQHDAVLWDGLSDVRSGWWQLMKLATSHGWTGLQGLMMRQAQRVFTPVAVTDDDCEQGGN